MLWFYLLFSFCFSSPHPLAGSTILNQPQNNLAFSQLGFKVFQLPVNWIFKNTEQINSFSFELMPVENKSKASLSFRTEQVSPKIDLEKYVRQYLRDYNPYGFDVVGLQSNKKNSTPSVIVDLTQKNKIYRSRQVFFQKAGKIILATCLDEYDSFEKTILICNQVLGTFQWH